MCGNRRDTRVEIYFEEDFEDLMGSEVSYTALVPGAKEGEALQAIAGDGDDTMYV